MKKYISIVLASALLAACGGAGNKEEQLKAKKAEFENLRKEIAQLEQELAKEKGGSGLTGKPVKLQAIAPVTFEHSIDVQGRVDAEESVSVGPQMPGLVKKVYVSAGDQVAPGQIMAEIDADAMIQQLGALKIQRDLSKQIYDKQKNLWEQKIGTEIQYLQTKTQYEAIEKQIAALQEQIDMAKIKAPIGGTVDQVNLKAGELASPGFSSIVIVNTSKLRVKAEVAEGYISKVKTGNAVNIFLPDANKTINTKVTYAGKLINKLNRTFNVEVAINPNEENVVPNMVAVLKINDYKNDSAIVAPLSIIQQNSEGKHYVFVAVKNAEGKLVAEKREIEYTWTYNGVAEITTGLKEGDQLITEGFNDLNPGDVLMAK